MAVKLVVFLLNFCLVSGGLISVETSLGTLIGQKKIVQNKTINVFYSVPYADPPVNELRFRRSRLIKRFPSDPYSALNQTERCPTQLPSFFRYNGSFNEDCLHANIWTPNLEDARDANGKCKKLHSVMLYIYGAQSTITLQTPISDENGQAHLFYSGELFAALHETILVTFNYRDILLATLYLENEFSGNLALFDQNLAMQFVKKHIGSFCGNSEKLTVFGNSLGSLLLSAHLISKYSRDLVDNAILQSASTFFKSTLPVSKNEIMINSFRAINDLGCHNYSDSPVNVDGVSERIKRKFFDERGGDHYLRNELFAAELTRNWYPSGSKLEAGKNLEKDDYIDRDLIQLIKLLSKYVDVACLQRVPIERLMEMEESTESKWMIHYDLDFLNTESYLDYKLFNKLNLSPKVNILAGIVAEERGGDVFLMLRDKNLLRNYYTDRFNAPAIPKKDCKQLIKDSNILETENGEFRQSMADFFTNETRWRLAKGYYDSYTNLIADSGFNCPMRDFSYYSAMSGANSVSNYVISYQTRVHVMHSYLLGLKNFKWLCTSHADELYFLFGVPFKMWNHFNDIDRAFSLELLELWTFFAKNGRMPKLSNGQEWPTSNALNPTPRYVEINGAYNREWKFEFEDRCESFFRPFLPLYKR